MIEQAGERERLEQVALAYNPSNRQEEFDYYLKRLQAEAIAPWLLGDSVLEMGCATGELTALLAPRTENYHVVEGSTHNIEMAARRVEKATFTLSLWEEFQGSGYSDVLCVCALEHVADPAAILGSAAKWMRDDGRIHIVVPNAGSIHRHVGVELGLLNSTTSLSESDKRIGHRRVYTVDALLDEVRGAALVPIHQQGIFLKVLSNQQMLGWDWGLIRALHSVGQRFPANCAELYLVAHRQ